MSEVKKFRKKTVVIEAMQFDAERKHGFEEAINWADARQWFVDLDNRDECYLSISTLEGRMIARNGDWIIRGVNGEFYSCKPDLFEQTHEEVQE